MFIVDVSPVNSSVALALPLPPSVPPVANAEELDPEAPPLYPGVAILNEVLQAVPFQDSTPA